MAYEISNRLNRFQQRRRWLYRACLTSKIKNWNLIFLSLHTSSPMFARDKSLLKATYRKLSTLFDRNFRSASKTSCETICDVLKSASRTSSKLTVRRSGLEKSWSAAEESAKIVQACGECFESAKGLLEYQQSLMINGVMWLYGLLLFNHFMEGASNISLSN